MKTLFSGIQPSGIIHIGNILGALDQWVKLQNEYNSIFCIVDLHATTTYKEPNELRKNVINATKTLIALGVDASTSSMFIQSMVPEHLQLYWALNSITRVSELQLMTQFKDKTKNNDGIKPSAGLLNYPVLMASDILLYNTNIVPVGEDQKQHIELTRELARRFNTLYGETFVLPDAKILKTGARIMGLDDPTKKMSKSASSEKNYISVMDTPNDIRKKIKTSQTDSGNEVKYDIKNKAGISNLLTIYSLMSGKGIDEIEKEYKNTGYGQFKNDLADVIIKYLEPIQKKYYSLDNDAVLKCLEAGAKTAQKIASKKIKEVYKKIGLR